MASDPSAPPPAPRPGRRRFLGFGAALGGAVVLGTAAALTGSGDDRTAPVPAFTVRNGKTVVLARTTRYRSLVVEPGGVLAAPAGKVLTLTVDGVETGTGLTAGDVARISPGTYRGDVVITVTERHPVRFYGLTFEFRQALYITADGPDAAGSVSAARRGRVGASAADGLTVVSTGEVFNGVRVDGGTYLLRRPRIELTGNGRSDFVGYGAALTASGTGARLVVDGARIRCRGAVRAAVVVTGGATAVVRNSRLHTSNGVLPPGYVPTVELWRMMSAPWTLGLSGNVRTTNLVGAGSTAAYVASTLSSEGWGVLSSDTDSRDCRLTAVNSRVTTAGAGYGSYLCDGVTQHFLGCDVDVAAYAAIVRRGALHYGDSTREAVRKLNTDWQLGLTEPELTALDPRPTTIRSRRFGVLWHGPGAISVDGGTVIRTGGATFLGKGQPARIVVDGSRGARLLPGDGILMQLMDDDDPGPRTMRDDPRIAGNVHREPTGPPRRVTDFDTTAAHTTDVAAEFTDIDLTGDFLNGTRGGTEQLRGLNLSLVLTRCRLTGVVSATTARHRVSVIDAAHYRELGVVTNTPAAVVNNGVILTLGPGSRWTPTGTCHLSALRLDRTARLTAPDGRTLSMTVDGRAVRPEPGGHWSGGLTIRVR
ncbi:hypothetical protein [Streptomyces sp. I05A-00742]|uniref:hypothetical protein n=1 Tax=Streptomyces sp. I05A-00742 TaxID=2732853 RepID=UPI0014876D45|nr:hypothetical protein [Streptomyces sp. I05A-00742]